MHIKPLRDRVKNTKYYASMGKIGQMLIVKRNNLVQIEHGYNVVKNIGYEQWEKISNFSHSNREIVKELVNED